MSQGKALIKGSALRTTEVVLQIAISLFMMPFIIHSLGERMYGFWVLVGTFIGYYGLLDLGLSSAVQRYLSRALGRNDTEEMDRVVNSSIVLFSLIGLCVLLISVLASMFCAFFIKNPNEIDLFSKIIILLGLSMAIGFPVRVYGGILISYLRYDLRTYASITRMVVANLLIFVFLKLGFGILALAVITFSATLLEYTITIFACRLIYPRIKPDFGRCRKGMIKELFKYSGKTFVSQVADILRFRVDALVIASFLNLNLVTYYSVASRLIEYFTQLIVSSIGIMAPVFSQSEGRGDYEAIRSQFKKATKISVIFAVFIGASIIFYGKLFIRCWMGSEFDISYNIILVLIGPYILALMQNPSIGLLYGISKHHFYAIANICEGILNLILSLILVRHYGLYGVALGTAIEMLLFKLFIQPVFTCRAINLSIAKYYLDDLLLTSTKVLIPLFIYFYLVRNLIREDYFSIVFFGGCQVLGFIPIAYFFILDGQERKFFKKAFKRAK